MSLGRAGQRQMRHQIGLGEKARGHLQAGVGRLSAFHCRAEFDSESHLILRGALS
jgi:hypothetical protein